MGLRRQYARFGHSVPLVDRGVVLQARIASLPCAFADQIPDLRAPEAPRPPAVPDKLVGRIVDDRLHKLVGDATLRLLF